MTATHSHIKQQNVNAYCSSGASSEDKRLAGHFPDWTFAGQDRSEPSDKTDEFFAFTLVVEVTCDTPLSLIT